MCTGVTLSYHPCDHRTIHYSTKCTDDNCLQQRHFPITFVNGYCMECMGPDNCSNPDSMKTVETMDTDVSSNVKAIGDKLDTLIQSCSTIAGIVNSEVRRRESFTKPVQMARLAQEVGLRPTDIKTPIGNTTITSKQQKSEDRLTQDITAPITALQSNLVRHLQFWHNRLGEAIEGQESGKMNVKAMRECLHASYQLLEDHVRKAFEEAEVSIALTVQERTYLMRPFAVMVFLFGFFFGVWFNNVWSKI